MIRLAVGGLAKLNNNNPAAGFYVLLTCPAGR
jgi:hypothetical protein